MMKDLNEMKMYSSNLVELYKDELDDLKSYDRIKNGIMTIIRIEFQNTILKFIKNFIYNFNNKRILRLKFNTDTELSATFNSYLRLITSKKCTNDDFKQIWEDIIPEFCKETQDVLNLLVNNYYENHYEFKVRVSIHFEEKEINGIEVILPNIELLIERK